MVNYHKIGTACALVPTCDILMVVPTYSCICRVQIDSELKEMGRIRTVASPRVALGAQAPLGLLASAEPAGHLHMRHLLSLPRLPRFHIRYCRWVSASPPCLQHRKYCSWGIGPGPLGRTQVSFLVWGASSKKYENQSFPTCQRRQWL